MHDVRTYIYIYIYKKHIYIYDEDFSQLYDKCGARAARQQVQKTFKNEQRNRDDTAKKRVNTSGVGESNN